MSKSFASLFRLIILGVGLGIITGTSVNIFNLQLQNNAREKKDISNFRNLSESNSTKNILNKVISQRKANFITNKSSRRIPIQELTAIWQKLASDNPDLKVSGFFYLIDEHKYAELLPNIRLSSASSIKIPILTVVLMMIESGELLWDEPLTLTKELIGSGAGWMAYQPVGKTFPVHEVSTEMIRISDNTATNLLIERIGGIDTLNKKFKSIGLKATELNNLLPDLNGTNTTSAKELAMLIANIDSGHILNPRNRDLFREVMSTSTSNRLIPGGLLKGLGKHKGDVDYNLLIKGFRVYNKTGDIGIAYSDAALIQTPSNKRAVASFIIMGPFNDPRSTELIRDMAAALVPILQSK